MGDQFTFALNRDEITKLYGEEDDNDIGNGWFVGESLSAIYDYEMAGGVWTEEEFLVGIFWKIGTLANLGMWIKMVMEK